MKKCLCVSFLLVLTGAGCSNPALAATRHGAAKHATVAKSGQTEEARVETPKTETPGNLEHGKEIFKNICSHCHHIDYTDSAVGAPGLRDVMERHTPEWEDTWLTSPAAFAKKDETAKALVQANPYGLTMPTFPEMQVPQNRKDVIEFLKTLKGE